MRIVGDLPFLYDFFVLVVPPYPREGGQREAANRQEAPDQGSNSIAYNI